MYLDLLLLGVQSQNMFRFGLQWGYHLVDENGLKYLYS